MLVTVGNACTVRKELKIMRRKMYIVYFYNDEQSKKNENVGMYGYIIRRISL